MAFKRDTRNLVLGTGKVLFSEASTLAKAKDQGLVWLGNTPSLQLASSASLVEHLGSYCGTRRVDRIWCDQADLRYQATLDEFSLENMRMIYLSGADIANNAQAASLGIVGQAMNANVTAGGYAITRGTFRELRDGAGNAVRHASSVSLVGSVAQYGVSKNQVALVKDVDYCYDPASGLVGFLTAIDNDTLVPTITAPAITSDDPNYMSGGKPLSKCIRTGYALIAVCDDDGDHNSIFEHRWFKASLTVTQGPVFGEAVSSFQIELRVVGDPGEWYVRKEFEENLGPPRPPILSGLVTAPAGKVGAAYTLAPLANGLKVVNPDYQTSPLTNWQAAGLPAGLSINAATGEITGTPTAAFTGNVTLTVDNGLGTSNAHPFALQVVVGPTTAGFPAIADQSDYQADDVTLDVSASFGGDAGVFGASGLPAGLSIDPVTGIISGRVSDAAQSSTPIITVTAATGFAQQTFSWTVLETVVAYFTAGNKTAVTMEVTLNAGSVYTPKWDMGDGTQLNGAIVNHTYASLGSYSGSVRTAKTEVTGWGLADQGLTAFTPAKGVALRAITLTGNNVTSLDVTGVPTMFWLNINDNGMNTLNITGVNITQHILASGNNLTFMDLSSSTALPGFIVNNNKLASLDFAGFTDLRNVQITDSAGGGSSIPTINLSSSINNFLALRNHTSLTNLQLSPSSVQVFIEGNSSLVDLDISNTPLLQKLQTAGTGFTDAVRGKILSDLVAGTVDNGVLSFQDVGALEHSYTAQMKADIVTLEGRGWSVVPASTLIP